LSVKDLNHILAPISPTHFGEDPKKLSFREMAIGELRRHRWCGDAYPENGWPSVNKVLAQYALEKRAAKLNKSLNSDGEKHAAG